MLRALTLALVGAGAFIVVSAGTASTASATPGMVSANGCHSRPRHCHSRSELRRNKRGRLYVPGAFGDGHRARHRRGRHR